MVWTSFVYRRARTPGFLELVLPCRREHDFRGIAPGRVLAALGVFWLPKTPPARLYGTFGGPLTRRTRNLRSLNFGIR